MTGRRGEGSPAPAILLCLGSITGEELVFALPWSGLLGAAPPAPANSRRHLSSLTYSPFVLCCAHLLLSPFHR